MTRRERTEILVRSSAMLAEACRRIEEHYAVHLIEPPNEGMVMIRMRDTARGGPFYIGEVLVTESKVIISDSVGLGIIKGSHPEQAYQLAVVDAAFNGKFPEAEELLNLLYREKEILERERAREWGRIMKTKVDFTTMEDFDVPKE